MTNILFVHQNFPGQFRHLAPALAGLGARVVALTINDPGVPLAGVSVVNYSGRVQARVRAAGKERVGDWESKVVRGQAAAEAMLALRDQGFVPDVVFAHSGWGEALFVRSVFPDARLLVYAEFFYGGSNGDIGFDPEFSHPSVDSRQRTILKNTHLLHALSDCDAALAPTEFQREQHPSWAREKISVIHEGIDTRHFRPDDAASIQLKAAGLSLGFGDEVVTFVARQLEPYRGYHTLMRALPLLQQLRPKARIVIVGGDGVSYGPAAPGGASWKTVFLEEVRSRLDMSRIHFVGKVPHEALTRLMQVSAVHVYLTYPFVLSWSLLEAMSIGCLVVASDTAPVKEVITHGDNGLLVDFFDPPALARRVAECLENPQAFRPLRERARASVVARYDLHTICLPRQIDFVLHGPAASRA
ncbi:MAG TPA: glycosyltransferase [Azonexus sp.]